MVELTIDLESDPDFFESRGDQIFAAIKQQMTVETAELLSYVKDTKLSGQVLKQRTGNLKNSGFTNQTDTPDEITGTVGFGMTVPYARIHEFGGTINIPEVQGKLMVFQANGANVFTTKHKAFTVQMPARPYLEPSLDENADLIRTNLQGAVNEAV